MRLNSSGHSLEVYSDRDGNIIMDVVDADALAPVSVMLSEKAAGALAAGLLAACESEGPPPKDDVSPVNVGSEASPPRKKPFWSLFGK